MDTKQEPLVQWLKDFVGHCVYANRGGAESPNALEGLRNISPPPPTPVLEARLHQELLSAETRAVRRNLLVSATISALVSFGAEPKFMVGFEGAPWLPGVAATAITLFLVLEFWEYARADARRMRIANAERDWLARELGEAKNQLSFAQMRNADSELHKKLSDYVNGIELPPRPRLRAGFDLLWPKCWGAFAVGIGLSRLVSHL